MRRLALALAVAAPLLVSASARAAVPSACGTVVLPAVIGVSATPTGLQTLDPVLMTGTIAEQNAIDLLFRPLIWLGRDRRIDWAHSLASAVATDADDTRFTVTLRPWHWSDGVAVTSADVLYTWDLIRALGPAYYDANVGGVPSLIASVAAPDARTVVFTLRHRTNPEWFEQLGLIQLTPLPRHVWQHFTIAEQQSLQSQVSFYRVGDGPFRLASLRLGREAVFVPNLRYDGHRATVARLVDVFDTGLDPIEAMRTGMIDAAEVPFELWSLANSLHLYDHLALGAESQVNTIIPNLRNPDTPFLDDATVRDAIARAIDQKRIIATVFHGQSEPQEGFVPTDQTADLPPELRGGGGPLAYDPAAAAKLLDEAGFRTGPDGIRTGIRSGRRFRLAFTLLISAGFPETRLLAEIVQQDLRRVGIAMAIQEVEFNQLSVRMLGPKRGWDAVLLDWGGGGYPDGTQWFASTSSQNYEGYADPEMDRLLDSATRNAGTAPLFALERYAVRQQPMIFLPDGDATLLVRRGLRGVDRLIGPDSEFSPEYLTLEGGMACDAPHA